MSAITFQTFERDFRYEKLLGKGNYATVTQVLHLVDNRKYAHKCIEIASLEQVSQAFNEIETIKCIDDERIVKLVYYYTRQNKKNSKYELGMIMELCYSNLADQIKIRRSKSNYFTKMDLKDFLASMIPFFAKMQKKGYLHRDIKPDNILLVKNAYNKFEYKIGDFGFAIKINAYSTLNIAGTMEYVSPKLMAKFKDNKLIVPGHNFKDDVYSFGKTLYEYMTLQLNEKIFDNKKILDCSNRYGPQIWGLVSLMLKQNQNQRPDFIYLQSYSVLKQIIPSNDLDAQKKSYLSISTVNGIQSKKSISLDKSDILDKTQRFQRKSKKMSKSKQKEDMTKTRKKQIELDQCSKQVLKNSKVNLKASKINDEKKDKKSLMLGEEIHSLIAYENFIIIGSLGKIGILLCTSDKLIKIKHESTLTPVTYMKIDNLKKYLLYASMNGKVYIIEINQIKKFIVQNHKQFQKRHGQQYQLKQLKYSQYDCNLPISTFQYNLIDQKKQPIFIIGHFNGQITIIRGDKKLTQVSFSKAPITHILYYSGYIFTSTGDGIFKKEASSILGLWSNKQIQSRKCKPFSQIKHSIYKYSDLIVTFQLIDKCKYNQSVTKQENKYLAIVISYDGFAHIISESFKLEKLIRITQNFILTAIFQIQLNSELGVRGWIADTQGDINTQKGILIEKTDNKNINCLAVHANGVYLGSIAKKLINIDKKETLLID